MANTQEGEGAHAALEDFLKVPRRLNAARQEALGALNLVTSRVGAWKAIDLIDADPAELSETIRAINEAKVKLAAFVTALNFGQALGDILDEALESLPADERAGFYEAVNNEDKAANS